MASHLTSLIGEPTYRHSRLIECLIKVNGQRKGLSFYRFRQCQAQDKQLKHIRLDHVMQYLLGEKSLHE